MTETPAQPADVVAAEAALEAAIRSHDTPVAVPEVAPVASVPVTWKEVLQGFLDSHSPKATGHATNAVASWITDATIYCQCALCTAGRAALG